MSYDSEQTRAKEGLFSFTWSTTNSNAALLRHSPVGCVCMFVVCACVCVSVPAPAGFFFLVSLLVFCSLALIAADCTWRIKKQQQQSSIRKIEKDDSVLSCVLLLPPLFFFLFATDWVPVYFCFCFSLFSFVWACVFVCSSFFFCSLETLDNALGSTNKQSKKKKGKQRKMRWCLTRTERMKDVWFSSLSHSPYRLQTQTCTSTHTGAVGSGGKEVGH